MLRSLPQNLLRMRGGGTRPFFLLPAGRAGGGSVGSANIQLRRVTTEKKAKGMGRKELNRKDRNRDAKGAKEYAFTIQYAFPLRSLRLPRALCG